MLSISSILKKECRLIILFFSGLASSKSESSRITYLSLSIYPLMMLSHFTSLPVFSLTRLYLIFDLSFLSNISKYNELLCIALYILIGILTNPNPIAPVQIALMLFHFISINRNNLLLKRFV